MMAAPLSVGLSPARFWALFAGLLILAGLFLLRNKRPVSYLRGGKAATALLFAILALMLGIKLRAFPTAQNVLPILALSVTLFSVGASYSIAFVLDWIRAAGSDGGEFRSNYKYELAIAGAVILTALPILTQSYFYYDDWWDIGTGITMNGQFLIPFGRPIHILLIAVFSNMRIEQAFLAKWIFLPALVMYAIVLHRWLSELHADAVSSALIACLLGVFGPAMDLLGYTSTSAVCYSILFSAVAMVCLESGWRQLERGGKGKALLAAVTAVVLLLTAFLTYQIGTQVVFVFLSLGTYFHAARKSLWQKNAAFLLVFSISAGTYLLFVKLSTRIYHAATITNRAATISSFGEVIRKFHFYGSVLDQSLRQIVAAFMGGGFIRERYHGSLITFTNGPAGDFAVGVVAAMIVLALVGYWIRTRNALGLATLLVFLPMSYYVFLGLSEDGYQTYYAFAHISLLMFYFLLGTLSCVRFVWRSVRAWRRELEPAHVLAPALVVCALASNYYVRDFYVDYNRIVYAYVKDSLQTAMKAGNVNRIHLTGLISPLAADMYSMYVAERALQDLGMRDSDYPITYSRSKNYLSIISQVAYEGMRRTLPIPDRRELDGMYALDSRFPVYWLKVAASPTQEAELHRIFVEAGALPPDNAQGTLVIDLTWTDQAYFNASP